MPVKALLKGKKIMLTGDTIVCVCVREESKLCVYENPNFSSFLYTSLINGSPNRLSVTRVMTVSVNVDFVIVSVT